jgi:hypothetical protein
MKKPKAPKAPKASKADKAHAELLNLLKKVLPKATHDPALASKIYSAIENEIKATARATAFEKFCGQVELPDLEPQSVQAVKQQLQESFDGGDVTLKPDKKNQSMAVEVALPDGSHYISDITVRPAGAEGEEDPENVLKFISFPVALPTDPELVWTLAKRENLTNEEAGIQLAKVEEEFWASKTGQKMIRDRVERSFPEFISRVPAGMLNEVGLKRHYKEPETLKVMHRAPGEK